MITAAFARVLAMDMTASLVILAVMSARLLLKKAPKVFSYALWGVVLFRLLCPASLPSPASALNLAPVSAEAGGFASVVQEAADAQEAPPAAGDGGACGRLMEAAPRVWLGGLGAMLLSGAVSLLRLRRRLVGAVLWKDNLYFADHLGTPFVLGVLRPRIYLPSSLEPGELDHILLHEQTHIRRGDHLLKLAGFAALSLHWFNPLVWAAFQLAGQDMEMSCDEAVLRSAGRDIRADYAASLLALSGGRRFLSGFPAAFDAGNTRGRVKNIMKYRQPAVWSTLAAAAAVGLLAVCLLSDPVEKAPASNPGAALAPLSSLAAYDTFSFVDLPPEGAELYGEPLDFPGGGAAFCYSATWVPSGLAVEVGLAAEDGTEYAAEAAGGSTEGTIADIPAGTYRVFLRNSGGNLQYANTAKTLDIFGAAAFGISEN